MLSIFMAIAQVFTDSGFGSALIQKIDRNNTDYSTVFYFNTATSIILYLILYLFAPYIADFYDTPQLKLLTRVIGLNLILMALCLIQKTIYRIELDFKTTAIISLISMLLSGIVGIVLAYRGFGVWALVFQTLSNNLLLTIILWGASKWRPVLVFSKKSFYNLFSFGSKLLVSQLLHTIFLNLYSLVIGKFYKPSDVGYYNRAYTIAQYPPINLMTIITNVLYPVQCNHQDDNEWLEQTFPLFIRLSCFIVFPIMVLLAVIAKPLVLIILSDKWLSSAPLISILALAYMWVAVGTLNNSLINSKGRSDIYLKAEIIKKVIAVLILIVTLQLGLIWLCIGLLIYNIIDFNIIIWFTRKIYPLGYNIQYKAFLPILLLSFVAGGITYCIGSFINTIWIKLTLEIIMYMSIYLILSIILRINELKIIKNLIRNNHNSLQG